MKRRLVARTKRQALQQFASKKLLKFGTMFLFSWRQQPMLEAQQVSGHQTLMYADRL
jgi:hypothetical protein